MSMGQLIKNNKLVVIVTLTYLILALCMPDKAAQAVSNSVYYLIEMMMVMPVIFLLTVVIETLIPKETIIKHFGNDSGFLGNIYALILGSISAGPIYAAFPICKMLLKKGANVNNIVIILSAWAVIKLPMLANEAKFLGVKFMGVRWGLTVAAILLMGWMAGKLIKTEVLECSDVLEVLLGFNQQPVIADAYCIGCGICAKIMPEVFTMVERKARVQLKASLDENDPRLNKAIASCPVGAIS